MSLSLRSTTTIYMCLGSLILIGNLAIILAVLLRTKLRRRKELLVIVGLSFGDAVQGLAYVAMGIHRKMLLSVNQTNWAEYSAFDCNIYTATPLFWYGAQCVAVMMTIVAVDRFISVRKPGFYLGLTARYAWILIISLYGVYGPITLSIALASAYSMGSTAVSAMCFGPWTVRRFYAVYHNVMQSVFSLTSCVIYVGVMLSLRAKTRSISVTSESQLVRTSRERQDKVTRILSLVVFTNLVLYSLPYMAFVIIFVFAVDMGGLLTELATSSWILAGLNSLINVSIFGFKHPDIRKSLTQPKTAAMLARKRSSATITPG